MILIEYLSEKHLDFPLQFFGTDINEAAIVKARAGVYTEVAVRDLSPERLRRFFRKEGKEYEFSKGLRESCIFAKHNLITDPPFSRLDLLSCQNVLIYFDANLQKKILPVFHYALKPTGFLVLGPAETVGAAPELFGQVKAGAPIYSKSTSASRLHFDFEGAQQAAFKLTPPQSASGADGSGISIGIRVQRETDRLCMAEFAPAGVVFNERWGVIQFRGRTGPYFEHSPGFASFDLLRMLKEGLVSEVRAAIDAVIKKGERIRREGIQMRFNGDIRRVAIELFPVRITASKERFFYLTFEDMDAPSYARANKRRKAKLAAEGNVSEAEQISALRNELTSTKDYLQSINEQKEAANEELRAANEEIMSSNEELQSTNEELHTAKEELQSTNEELMTVNDELRVRNRDLSRLNDDQNNLFASLDVAIIMVTKELRIRKLTPMAEKMLGLVPSDIGRSMNEVRPRVEVRDLGSQLLEVIHNVKTVELEVPTAEGQWYSVQIRPYRTSDDRIDGAVVLFSNVTRIKCGLEYAEEIEETIGQPLLFLSADLRVKNGNDRFYEAFETGPKETLGKFVYELDQLRLPKLRALLENILPGQSTVEDFELPYDLPKMGKKTIRLKARRLRSHLPNVETILVVLELIPRTAP
jgi:two-component system CheB/CheR fusion protein